MHCASAVLSLTGPSVVIARPGLASFTGTPAAPVLRNRIGVPLTMTISGVEGSGFQSSHHCTTVCSANHGGDSQTNPSSSALNVIKKWEFSSSPGLPSGAMMADFILGYRHMLENASASGDCAAAVGADVLEHLRAWLAGHHGHPDERKAHSAGAMWHKNEGAIEMCLWELEKDIENMNEVHGCRPARLQLQIARLHCTEAASLLRKL